MSPQIAYVRAFRSHPYTPADEEFPFAWLEGPLAARLALRAEVPDWNDLKLWPSGRIFGETGEYRWERAPDGSVQAVLLLEGPGMPVEFSGITDLVFEEEGALVLWGDWVDPTKDPKGNEDGGPRFYAPELPHIQTYPLELSGPPAENEAPRLLVRRYRDAQGEKGRFMRCAGVALRA